MYKIFCVLFIALAGNIHNSYSQWLESFTGQADFGNPIGWSTFGPTSWNVYETHGNPSFGLTRNFSAEQHDSIKTSDQNLISVLLNDTLKVDARIMTSNLYPSTFATLPSGATVTIYAFDGLVKVPIITLTEANQNTSTNWITLKGSLNNFAGSQIQLILSGKMGSNLFLDDISVDLDNFKVGNVVVGLNEVNSSSLKVFPNPCSEKLSISGINSEASLTIYDFLKNKVSELRKIDTNTEIDVSGFSPGIYFAKIGNTEKTIIQKIVIQ